MAHWLTIRLIDWLFDWLHGLLIDHQIVRLIDWLIERGRTPAFEEGNKETTYVPFLLGFFCGLICRFYSLVSTFLGKMEEARQSANENAKKKNVPTAAGTAQTSQKSKKPDVNSLFFGSSSTKSGSTVKPKKSEEGEPLGGMKKSGGQKIPKKFRKNFEKIPEKFRKNSEKISEKFRKKREICSSVKSWYFLT